VPHPSILGDHMSRLKRDCNIFDHHVPLSRQTLNGTLFVPFLEDDSVLIIVSPYYYIQYCYMKKKLIKEINTIQYNIELRFII